MKDTHLSPPQKKTTPTKRKTEESSKNLNSEYAKSVFMTAEITNNFLLFSTHASASPVSNLQVRIRGFLDLRSPHTYIQANLALQQLQLKPIRQNVLELQGVGENTLQPQTSHEVKLYLQTQNLLPLEINANTLTLITKHKFPFEIEKIREKFPQLRSLQYADVQLYLPVTLLIGNDHMWPLIKSVETLERDIYAIHTLFGYIVVGKSLH